METSLHRQFGRLDQARCLIDYLRSRGMSIGYVVEDGECLLSMLSPFMPDEEVAEQVKELRPEILALVRMERRP